MARLTYITEFSARMIAERLAERLFRDMPAFKLLGTNGRDRLLAALAQPQWPQYRNMQTKAGVLHYHLNKAHAYADGNKRVALTATELFVLFNDGALIATDDELEEFALGVARNDISVEQNNQFLAERILRLSWSETQMKRWARRLSPEGIRALNGDGGAPRVGRFGDGLTAVVAELEEQFENVRARPDR